MGGYWGADGQWYAYPPQDYDPNAYPQEPQQQAYDPNYGYYDPNAYPQQPQPQGLLGNPYPFYLFHP